MRHLSWALPGLLLCALACTGGETGADAGAADAATCNTDNLPAASDPCLAQNPCGNELAVGQVCTRGGAECSGNGIGNAIFCSADFNTETVLHFCTRPCVLDEDCGAGARCTVDPDDPDSESGCLPLACDETADGGS